MNSGQVVDRNDADQHGRQFDQVPFLALRGCKLGLASTKVAAAVGDQLYALAGAHRNVLHLDSRVALVVLLCPLVVERGGNTGSRPDQNNGFLSKTKRVTQTDHKDQRKPYPQNAGSAGTLLRGLWYREFCFGFHRGASQPVGNTHQLRDRHQDCVTSVYFTGNHHPAGRGGRMPEETAQDYSFFALVLEITFAALYLSSTTVSTPH